MAGWSELVFPREDGMEASLMEDGGLVSAADGGPVSKSGLLPGNVLVYE